MRCTVRCPFWNIHAAYLQNILSCWSRFVEVRSLEVPMEWCGILLTHEKSQNKNDCKPLCCLLPQLAYCNVPFLVFESEIGLYLGGYVFLCDSNLKTLGIPIVRSPSHLTMIMKCMQDVVQYSWLVLPPAFFYKSEVTYVVLKYTHDCCCECYYS